VCQVGYIEISVKFGHLAKSTLSLPSVFDLCQRLLGSDACHRRLIEDFAKPRPGERVVDLGCGTGASLRPMPKGVSYVGVDINPHYIEAARAQLAGRGTFLCADLATANLSQFPPFDLAILAGVLHHLNDAEAGAVLELVRRIVKPGGRLVTMDPCYVPGQHAIAKFMLDHDRGRHIRNADDYRRLFESQGVPETRVFSEMLRIPFTTIIATLGIG
jgi:SAM-dependent methyltransferase